jgi:hypothetical protein
MAAGATSRTMPRKRWAAVIATGEPFRDAILSIPGSWSRL